ncbi:MAG: DUF4340 domain-containing protein [Bacteroidales bacterium]
MKKTKLTLIITITLAIIALFFIYTTTKSTIPKALKDFAIADTSLVTKIFLTDKSNNKVILEKKAPGKWSVNNKYTVSNGMITVLLKTIMMLEVKSPVAKSARNNVIKRLASSSVKIEIYQTVYRIDFRGIKLFSHEKLVKTYYVGDATMDNMGTFMLIEDSDEPFIMHIPGFRGFLNSRYSTIENDWRDHTLFNIDIPNIRSVKLEFPSGAENSYEIVNIGDVHFTLTALSPEMQITDYDTLRLYDFLSTFRDIRYESIITDTILHNKDSIVATIPFHILTVTDMSGKKAIVKTFHKKPNEGETEPDGSITLYDKDRLYALFNNDKDFALIQFYVFDNILRPLPYFIKTTKAIRAPLKTSSSLRTMRNETCLPEGKPNRHCEGFSPEAISLSHRE